MKNNNARSFLTIIIIMAVIAVVLRFSIVQVIKWQ